MRYVILDHNRSGQIVKEIDMNVLSSFADLLKKVNVKATANVEVKCGSEVISDHSTMLHEHSDVVNELLLIYIGESGLVVHSG